MADDSHKIYEEGEKPVIKPDLKALEEGVSKKSPSRLRTPDKPDEEPDNNGLSPEQLQDSEANRGFWKEGESGPDKPTGESGSLAGQAASVAAPGFGSKALSLVTKKRAAAGGGIAATLIGLIVGFSGLSAFQLQFIRENALNGRGTGGITKRIQEKMRTRSVRHAVRKIAKGQTDPLVKSVVEGNKLDSALGRYGIGMTRDAEGQLVKLGFRSGTTDVTHTLTGLTDDQLDNVLNDFFGNSEVEEALGKALKYEAASWRGKAASRVYQFMKVRFTNWLDRAPSETATTDEEKLSDNLRHADDELPSDANRNLTQSADELADDTTESVDDLGAEIDGADEYRRALLDDPSLGDEALDDIAGGAAKEVIDEVSQDLPAALAPTAAEEEAINILQRVTSRIATRSPLSLVVGGAKGLNIFTIPQEACRINGTLKYIASVRNIIFAYELARFSVKILTAADNQRAGLVSSDGLHLLMQWLNRANPANGRAAMQSGGIQYLLGNSAAQVSTANLSRVSTGRNNDGILAAISHFLETNPITKAAVGPTTCKVVNNGLVNVAGFAVGALFAVFGGSQSGATEVNLATSLALQASKEVAYAVGTPILVKSGAHMAMNGLEDGELVGDAFASGFGALTGMAGGAGGLRPVTKQQAAILRQEASEYNKAQLARQSLFDRYLSLSNGTSLASTTLAKLPASFSSLSLSLQNFFPKMMSSLANFNLGQVFGMLTPGRVGAAQDQNQCQDRQILDHDIETDPFCNPVMAQMPDLDIDETEQILLNNRELDPSTYQPADDSAFANYIDACFKGDRTNVLYKLEVSQSGNNNPETNECIDAGAPLPGDTVGQNDRFSIYYNYLNNIGDLSDVVNGGYYGS